MRPVLILLLVFGFITANAQEFKKRQVIPLAEKLQSIQGEWVSVDSDSLADFILTGVTSDEQVKIYPFGNILNAGFIAKTSVPTAMKSGRLQVADWNRDNKMDFLFSGKNLVNADVFLLFQITGGFTLQGPPQKLMDQSGVFRLADLNNDGTTDIVFIGGSGTGSYIRIIDNTGTELKQRLEIKGITVSDLSIFDLNQDGVQDISVSGIENNKPLTATFYGKPDFKFRRQNLNSPINGALNLSDTDNDGYFDVTVIGKNELGVTKGQIWTNPGDSLLAPTTFTPALNATMFSGDMTSDGKSDFHITGKDALNKTLNYVMELPATTTPLDTTGLLYQRMGDKDRDGDLDLIQVIDSIGSQWLKYYENTTAAVNRKPEIPTNHFAVSAFEKTFIFWDAPVDDLTPKVALTFDVWLGKGTQTIIAPSYDFANDYRKTVSHGNAGTNTSMIVRNLADDRYFYWIQAVDNAYNGSHSVGGNCTPCFDLAHSDVEACKGSEVKLGAGSANAYWYSLSRGMLARGDSLKFVASVADTIFSFTPQQNDCSKNRVYVLHLNDGPPNEKETVYACKGKATLLEISEGWTEQRWNTTPPVLNVSSINYNVTKEEIITVTAKGQGCDLKKEFTIKLSEPIVTIDGDGFRVLKGNSVQLEGRGNAETWLWTPPSGLSDAASQSPEATPAITTEYILTGTDSVGCTATARTTVLVQETAFVPNLFTPNGDGKNDNLTIYGLTSTGKFNFRIFNREGSTVYETKDIAQASTVGWNGFVQGTRQPSGIYYWKVDGETPDGAKLLLNGKSTGSILLVH